MNNDKYQLVDPSTRRFGLFCTSAVRYALGRRTYISCDTIRFLKKLMQQYESEKK